MIARRHERKNPHKPIEEAERNTIPLWDALRSWWSNEAAERCKSLHWLLAIVFFVASSLALALPFAAGRWREASFNAKSAQYPGLGAAFMALAESSGEFEVHDGKLMTKSAAPQILYVGDWIVVFGEKGDPGAWKAHRGAEPTTQPVSPATSVQPVPHTAPKTTSGLLWFGENWFAIHSRSGEAGFVASWRSFEGFNDGLLKRAAQNRQTMADLIESMLFTANFRDIESSLMTLFLLMLVQNGVYIMILGFLLSLSALRLGRLQKESSRKIEPAKAIKIVIFAIAGPAFLTGLVGLAIPSLPAPMLWLFYSLAAGIRVLAIYSARYQKMVRA